MTTYSKQSEHLEREFSKLQAELAALKDEHTRLREAAEKMHHAAMHGTISRRTCDQLRAALDADPADEPRETFDPSAVRVLLRWLLDMEDTHDGAYTRELAQLVRDSETK